MLIETIARKIGIEIARVKEIFMLHGINYDGEITKNIGRQI